MGRKSSAKAQSGSRETPPPQAPRSRTRFIVAGAAVVLIAAGSFAYWKKAGGSESSAATATTPVEYPQPILDSHSQETYPPLQFPGYPMPRTPEVVRAAYQFAAEHPEVLSYVPCFCGCERAGHRGNEDCFVRQRAANGDVIAWDDHGMECAVCLDVADLSRKMFASGASVKDIRAAVEQRFGGKGTIHNHTPTPAPPEKGAS